ncbi:MAG: hypothetical protein ACXWPM_01110 [Bdellovibrionota bacterium]
MRLKAFVVGERNLAMRDQEPDESVHGECIAEFRRMGAELAILRDERDQARKRLKTFDDAASMLSDEDPAMIRLRLAQSRADAASLRSAVQYFVDRCEGNHPDGVIRSKKTYALFKEVLSQSPARGLIALPREVVESLREVIPHDHCSSCATFMQRIDALKKALGES